MLRTRARWVFRPGEVELAQVVMRSPRVIVGHTRARGLPVLELGGARPLRGRGWLWLVRRGEAFVETPAGEQILREGEVLGAPQGRLLRTTPSVDLLQVYFPYAEVRAIEGGLGASEAALMERLVTALGSAGPTENLDRLSELAGALGASTLQRLAREMRTPSTLDSAHRIADLLSAHVSQLDRQPALVDFARRLQQDERRASESLSRHIRTFHAGFKGWRDYLHTLRLELAMGLLAERVAPVKTVAEWLGYRAPHALYHALGRRGLSPDSLRPARGHRPPGGAVPRKPSSPRGPFGASCRSMR